MISDELRRILNLSTMEVFGTMYFTPVELLVELPDSDQCLEELYIESQVEYSGPHSAALRFYFPHRLALHIAAGFLGIEEDDLSSALVIDTMQEAVNMIVGNYLGQFDKQGECSLGIPKAKEVSELVLSQDMAGAETLAFASDFGFVWLCIS